MPSKEFVLEICAESLDCAIAAQRAGAHRIELCSSLSVGGLTPSAGTMQAARAHLRIPIHALIRPRPGNFVYTDHEFEIMRKDVCAAKQLGMNGIAVGILDSESRVDAKRMREIIRLARPMSVTFHRAFDASVDMLEALEQVIDLDAERILTSGPNPKAADSIPVLARLVQAAAARIIIMPAGGVSEENVAQILSGTSAHEIHSSLGASRVAAVGQDYEPMDASDYERRVSNLTSLLRSLAARNAGVKDENL